MSSPLEIEPDARDEPITEPPKRWRNWWRSPCRARNRKDGREINPHEDFPGPGVWPSREIAEQIAEEDRAKPCNRGLIYVGAFPDGEAP